MTTKKHGDMCSLAPGDGSIIKSLKEYFESYDNEPKKHDRDDLGPILLEDCIDT